MFTWLYNLFRENHCSGIELYGKYFEYPPNPYYFDVTIEKERLDTLPESPSHVNLPTVDASHDQETDDHGPAKDQFDHLSKDEEIPSYSGIAVPLNMQDADEEVKKPLNKFLKNSSQTWEYVIEAGKVAAMKFAKSRGQIHDHSEYFSREHYQRVKGILDIDDTNGEVKKADLLQEWLQNDDTNTDSVFSPKFVSMHPASDKYI